MVDHDAGEGSQRLESRISPRGRFAAVHGHPSLTAVLRTVGSGLLSSRLGARALFICLTGTLRR